MQDILPPTLDIIPAYNEGMWGSDIIHHTAHYFPTKKPSKFKFIPGSTFCSCRDFVCRARSADEAYKGAVSSIITKYKQHLVVYDAVVVFWFAALLGAARSDRKWVHAL